MFVRSSLSALALVAAIALPGAASAQEAFSRNSTWLRAGPGGDYPPVARVSRGEGLDIFGCLRGRSWCDVAADGDRGWIRGSSIDYLYSGRRVIITNPAIAGVAVLSFGMADYWDSHYRSRPWYREPRYWRGPDRDRAPDRRRDGPGDGIRDGRPGPDRPAIRPPQPREPEAVRPERPRPPQELRRPPSARDVIPERPRERTRQLPPPEPRAMQPRTERPAMQQQPRPQRGPEPGAEPRRPQAPAGRPGPRPCPPGGDCR